MNADRIPVDLEITAQDFADCGWREVLTDEAVDDYSSMWRAFSTAAKKAMDEGRGSHAKVLKLLADACSMMLTPNSVNSPFKPIMVGDGMRTPIPDDLTKGDITLFTQIIDEIDDARLRARLADLVWLLSKPREVKFAQIAIDEYRKIPLNTETWVRDGRECWGRAIDLTRMLRDGDRLHEIEAAIIEPLLSTIVKDGYLALWLAELLKSQRLGRDQCTQISDKLEELANEFEKEAGLERAVDYWRSTGQWFEFAKNKVKAAQAICSMAECQVKQAQLRLSSENPSHMAAAGFFEDAIQTYRTVPKSLRSSHGVDERIAELRRLMSESGEKSIGEMGRIQSPGVDITELVEHARKAVSGKSAADALKSLANLHPLLNFAIARENALEMLRKHPLQAMFQATVMSHDGRVVAKRPGLSLGAELTADDEIVIRSQMIKDYEIQIGLVVSGEILPALEVMQREHRFSEADFMGLAAASPVVPKNREQLFGKGLYAGYDSDFGTAIYLLMPQIENMVRHAFKQAGVKTTTLDANGIENEIGLSSLMDLADAEKIFGNDLAFEFKALFCDAHGPNLRNMLAHGLLDDSACRSVYFVYAWWLALKLVFNSFEMARRQSLKRTNEDEDE